MTRRDFLRVGAGTAGVLLLQPVPALASLTRTPPLDGFRSIACCLTAATDSDVAQGAQAFQATYTTLTAEWQGEYRRIIEAGSAGLSTDLSRERAQLIMREALSDPSRGAMAQTALNLADLYVPGNRFRNDIDNVILGA